MMSNEPFRTKSDSIRTILLSQSPNRQYVNDFHGRHSLTNARPAFGYNAVGDAQVLSIVVSPDTIAAKLLFKLKQQALEAPAQ
jgi:hypothetical protein